MSSLAGASTAAQLLPFNGPLMIAVNTAWLLYGCLAVQTYHYFSMHCKKDFWLKFVVAAVGLAATMHVGFGTATQWGIFVEYWGDAAIWKNTPWEIALAPFTSCLNGFIVQIFFVVRILRLSKNVLARSAAVAISVTSLLSLSGSITTVILFLKSGSNTLAVAINLQTFMRLWSVSTVTCDVLIAVTMTLILSYAHSQAIFKSTRNLLSRLIIQSIETGTITAVDMLLFLICYEATTTNSAYMVWGFASGPLYGNVLLFILNSRQAINERVEDIQTLSDMIYV